MKYKALLEGLEIVEVKKNKAFNIDFKCRIDAEFFQKKIMCLYKRITSLNHDFLSGIAFVSDGEHGSVETTDIGYSKYYGARNVLSGILNDNGLCYINKQQHEKLYKTALKGRDVLIACVGANIGCAAIVPDNIGVANIVRNVALLRAEKSVCNEYLLAYFLSRYGKALYKRMNTGNAQPLVSLDYIKTIPVFIPEYEIQRRIKQKVSLALEKKEQSELLYSSIESHLLECLGMTDFAVNPDAYNVKTLKESFLETGRFDAEYYLPKYEDYCRLVQSYSNGYEPLNDACDIKDTNYTPEAGVRYKYIELANIGKSGEITECDLQDGENLPTRARRLVHQGDVIISSIEGSLESCALVTEDYEGALCSTGFYVLQSSKLNPETLLTLFKSLPMQQLMKKGCSGTILTAISKPELEKLPVPIIRQEVQDEIARHVQKSFALRKEAMQLLENAKLTVEQAIENGGGNLLIFNKLRKQSIQEERYVEWLLLTEIGVLSTTDRENKTVKAYKKLSNSFLSSGRLDAEYYQPKYDYLFSHLSEFATSTIGELTEIRKSIEPGSDAYQETGVPFIRVSDLSKFGVSDTALHLNAEDYRDVIRPKKDTILLSKDGSVGIAYKVEEPLDVITSGAILHLSLKSADVLPDYLTLVLNSPIVRLQAERDAGGSIIQHWKPSEIENVVIPILPMQIQQEIADKIRSSFKLRKESQHLLDEAKRMVEVAIESIA